jgi:hypothetical protein
MFCNQYHLNHSDNKLWAEMFQTSLISLLCYLYLLSPKFCDECHRYISSSCCDLILWSQLYENLITFLSLFSLYSSTYNLFMLKSPIKSKGFSRHTHLVILQWLLPSTLISSGVIVSCYFWWMICFSSLKSLSSESRDEILFRGGGCDSSCTCNTRLIIY